MDAVALVDRNDTKYVIHVDHLYRVLASLREQYYLLDINGIREYPYQTLYSKQAARTSLPVSRPGRSWKIERLSAQLNR